MTTFVLYLLFAVFMSVKAVNTSLAESKRLSEISAFVFWICTIIELFELIA